MESYSNYTLYDQDDIAVVPMKNFTDLELSLGLDKKDAIVDSVKAEVVLVGDNVPDIQKGEVIFYDPAFARNIEEIGTVVLNKKSILLKGKK